jgi:lipoprotein-anchoring transpeptidase ErfK/SrfK
MKRRSSWARLAKWVIAALAAWAGLCATPARAGLVVQIDKSSQRMTVSVDGMTRYQWPVSTGRRGFGTPTGSFHPQSMARRYFSRKYYNSPMPHAIFFHGGFAIHGTNDISRLGGPASHGCVRLHPSHAATLFALVERNGPRQTRIDISN